MRPEQCILITYADVMDVFGDLWIDRVYLRLKRLFRDNVPRMIEALDSARLWMTNVTLQGDGNADRNCQGLFVSGSVYAEGLPLKIALS
jgi:hypothetical protein